MSYTIKLNRAERSLTLKHVTRNIEINRVGRRGPQGAKGDDGEGVPVGGTTGQVLKKASSTDYDTEWESDNDFDTPQTIAIANALVAGTSYEDERGIGIVNTPKGKYSTIERATASLGIPMAKVTNLAVSGAAIRAHNKNGVARVLQNVNPGNTQYVPQIPRLASAINGYGTNDAIFDPLVSSFVSIGYKNSYKALIAREIASAVWENDDSTVSYTGTWSTVTYTEGEEWGSGLSCSASSTAGDLVTITLPSDLCDQLDGVWVDVGFVTTRTTGGVVAVAVDGELRETINTSNATFDDTERGAIVSRVWVTADDSEITCTISSLIGGGPVWFDYWSVEANPTPMIFNLENTVPPNPNVPWTGITPERIDLFNGYLQEVIDEFDNPSIVLTPLDDAWGGQNIRTLGQGPNSDFTYYSNDGLHPNERGAIVLGRQLSLSFRDALRNGVDMSQVSGYFSQEDDYVTTDALIVRSGAGDPPSYVDRFDVPDSNSTPDGWTARRGGWGIINGQAGVVNDLWPYPAFEDQFDRANGAVGNGWTALRGTWAIDGEELELATTAGGGIQMITSPTSLASGNGYVEAVVGDRENNSSIVFRQTSLTQYWEMAMSVTFGSWVLRHIDGVTTTNVQNGGLGSNATGTNVHIELDGNDIAIFINGALQYSTTNSKFATASGVGYGAASLSSTDPSWQYIKVGQIATDVSDLIPFNGLERDFNRADGVFRYTVGEDRVNFKGVYLRYVDSDNYTSLYMSVSFGGWVFFRRIAGVDSTTNIAGSNFTNDIVEITMDGNDFTFRFNGEDSSTGTQTVAGGPQGTIHGLRVNSTSVVPTASFDDVVWGETVVDVPDGGSYVNSVTGEWFVGFVGGLAATSLPWIPSRGLWLTTDQDYAEATVTALGIETREVTQTNTDTNFKLGITNGDPGFLNLGVTQGAIRTRGSSSAPTDSQDGDGVLSNLAVIYSSGTYSVAGGYRFVQNGAGVDFAIFDRFLQNKFTVDHDGNTDIQGDLNVDSFIYGARPYAELAKTVAAQQDINWGATGSVGYISWDSQLHLDTGFTHSTSTNNTRITAVNTGRYEVIASIKADNSGINRFTAAAFVRINGTTITEKGSISSYSRGAAFNNLVRTTFVGHIDLTAGQYIEVGTRVDDRGQADAVNTVDADCSLIIRRIG